METGNGPDSETNRFYSVRICNIDTPSAGLRGCNPLDPVGSLPQSRRVVADGVRARAEAALQSVVAIMDEAHELGMEIRFSIGIEVGHKHSIWFVDVVERKRIDTAPVGPGRESGGNDPVE